ncbi:hypothetical protein L7F22_062281 [Adiantum nelumboides]|nr:hypothetical protein [Adiantum nelumboides]
MKGDHPPASSGSQRCICVLNLLTMLLSIPVVGTGFWLASKHNTECTRFLQTPILCIGFLMLLLSMAGFVGSCWAIRWLLWIYLFVMFLLILTLLGFTTFALAVTSNESHAMPGGTDASSGGGNGSGGVDSAEGIHEYQLSYYSGWLTQRVQKEENWVKIKSCLTDAGVCASSPDLHFLPNFLYRHLNPLQVGCCKPPAVCQYMNVNGSEWANPMNASATLDCGLWSNTPRERCLACSTCKAGLLANLRHDWSKVALVNVFILVLLLLIYILACCVSQNASKRRRHHHHQLPLEYQPHPPSPTKIRLPL